MLAIHQEKLLHCLIQPTTEIQLLLVHHHQPMPLQDEQICTATSSVPFKWEEAPGKPRPFGTELGVNLRSSFRVLQLPPRLQLKNHGSETCSGNMANGKHFDHSESHGIRPFQCVLARGLLARRHTMIDSRKSSFKVHPRRAARRIFSRTRSDVLSPASAIASSTNVCRSQSITSATTDDEPVSPIPTFASLLGTSLTGSSVYPDLSTSSPPPLYPDLGPDIAADEEADSKHRRKPARERLQNFFNAWRVIRNLKQHQKHSPETEMWSPTLATYLYNASRVQEGSLKGSHEEDQDCAGEDGRNPGSYKCNNYMQAAAYTQNMEGNDGRGSLRELMDVGDDRWSDGMSCSSGAEGSVFADSCATASPTMMHHKIDDHHASAGFACRKFRYRLVYKALWKLRNPFKLSSL